MSFVPPLVPHHQTVFYVEDLPANVMLMEALINLRPQLRLVSAANMTRALRMAPQVRPALLLLDLLLPDGHGVDLLRRLRQQPAFARVPAVAVTADDDFQPAGTGFCEVWRKPLHVSHVLRRLDHFVHFVGDAPPAMPLSQVALPRHPTVLHR